jgi:hypothetical protein
MSPTRSPPRAPPLPLSSAARASVLAALRDVLATGARPAGSSATEHVRISDLGTVVAALRSRSAWPPAGRAAAACSFSEFIAQSATRGEFAVQARPGARAELVWRGAPPAPPAAPPPAPPSPRAPPQASPRGARRARGARGGAARSAAAAAAAAAGGRAPPPRDAAALADLLAALTATLAGAAALSGDVAAFAALLPRVASADWWHAPRAPPAAAADASIYSDGGSDEEGAAGAAGAADAADAAAPSDVACGVCLAPLRAAPAPTVHLCGHAFHARCAARWQRTQALQGCGAHTCPTCRFALGPAL